MNNTPAPQAASATGAPTVQQRIRARLADDHGTGYFTTALVILLALTVVGCLSLLIDGGRIASARRNADQIAFQAARSAAQQLDPDALRHGSAVVDSAAGNAASTTVTELLSRAGLDGQMTGITVDNLRITVTVTVNRSLTTSALFGQSDITVTGTGSARVGTGVVSEETPLP